MEEKFNQRQGDSQEARVAHLTSRSNPALQAFLLTKNKFPALEKKKLCWLGFQVYVL